MSSSNYGEQQVDERSYGVEGDFISGQLDAGLRKDVVKAKIQKGPNTGF